MHSLCFSCYRNYLFKMFRIFELVNAINYIYGQRLRVCLKIIAIIVEILMNFCVVRKLASWPYKIQSLKFYFVKYLPENIPQNNKKNHPDEFSIGFSIKIYYGKCNSWTCLRFNIHSTRSNSIKILQYDSRSVQIIIKASWININIIVLWLQFKFFFFCFLNISNFLHLYKLSILHFLNKLFATTIESRMQHLKFILLWQ